MVGDDLPLFSILDDDGNDLDANFRLGKDSKTTFSLFVESRGGEPPRNTQYNDALEHVLRRLGRAKATITKIEVVSSHAMTLRASQRKVKPEGSPLPIKLQHLTNDDEFKQLRVAIGAKVAETARLPGASGGGNMQKRLRIYLTVHPAPRLEQLRRIVRAAVRYDNVPPVLAAADKPQTTRKRSSSGQGHEPDKKIRKAVENYAMRQAELHFDGWRSERLHTQNYGYDIEFSRKREKLHAEVKGTRSTEPKTVIVTLNEVRYAFHNPAKVVLVVVSGIRVDKHGGAAVCSGGRVSVYYDWGPEEWTTDVGTGLRVKDYYFTLPKHPDETHDALPDGS